MQTSTPTIDDLITRGIPGAILITSVIVSAIGNPPALESNAVILGFVAISYAAGTLLDLHKHDVFTAPPHFRRLLYSADNKDEDYLRGITKLGLALRRSWVTIEYNRVPLLPDIKTNVDYTRESIFSSNGKSIVEVIESREPIEVSPENLKEAWTTVEGQSSPELNRLGSNEHTVYHFLLNFFLSATISVVLLVYGIVVVRPGAISVILLLGVFVAVVLMIQINLFGRYGTRYSKRVVNEYYSLVIV